MYGSKPAADLGAASQAMQRWRQRLWSRRRFLLGLAGGSMAALFGPPSPAQGEAAMDPARRWQVLDALQQHLFPSEPEAPGAKEINALGYLRFVVADPKVEQQTRRFILRGTEWLEGMAEQLEGQSFLQLDTAARERVLRQVARSEAGENWISTLLLYIMEALLTDPVYGGNPDGVGWRWLEHIPGYPRPPADKTYPRLG